MSRKRHARDKAGKTSAEDEKNAEETPSETVETLEEKQLRFIASFLSKPWLKVQLESKDPISAKSIKISGKKLGEQIASGLQKILPLLRQLQRLQLWRAGLTNGMVISLQNTISLCSNLRVVILEGNPLLEQNYHCLLSEDSILTHLSLRNNQIGDDCARLIGSALSTTRSSNKNLLSLNLAFNCIGDAGAAHIAKGLRFNHALLFLSLANNWIGESGAACLAEILGDFALTHEEVVERRKLVLEILQPGSVLSLRADSTQTNADELPKVPSSISVNISKGEKKGSKKRGASSKEKLESKKKALSAKTQNKSQKTEDKESQQTALEVESAEPGNPLLEKTPQYRCEQLFLPGNSTLASLNLAGNRITEKTLPLFQTSLEMQKEGEGLLRLCLQRNYFPEECESYVKIKELLAKRHERKKSSEKKQTDEESTK